ncbi:hypothetical protein OK016_09365 [Vibrio chagasii]|nr:hypothetical protein [Vibrio chagasii]
MHVTQLYWLVLPIEVGAVTVNAVCVVHLCKLCMMRLAQSWLVMRKSV